MCFSATASFTTASALALCGIYALHKAPKSFKLLGAIPLLFGIQQASEGVLWLSLMHQWQWHTQATYFFLFFAGVIWPTWIPLAIRTAETNPKNYRWLTYSLAIGVFFSITQIVILGLYGATSSIVNGHILYTLLLPPFLQTLEWPGTFLYWCAVVAPGFICTIAKMRYFASLLAGSYIAAFILYYTTTASIWCFFSALLSGLLVLIIREQAKK